MLNLHLKFHSQFIFERIKRRSDLKATLYLTSN